MTKNPCFRCPDRTSECHADCPSYGEYVKSRREYLTLRWKTKKTKRDLADIKAGCIRSCTHGKIKRAEV